MRTKQFPSTHDPTPHFSSKAKLSSVDVEIGCYGATAKTKSTTAHLNAGEDVGSMGDTLGMGQGRQL